MQFSGSLFLFQRKSWECFGLDPKESWKEVWYSVNSYFNAKWEKECKICHRRPSSRMEYKRLQKGFNSLFWMRNWMTGKIMLDGSMSCFEFLLKGSNIIERTWWLRLGKVTKCFRSARSLISHTRFNFPACVIRRVSKKIKVRSICCRKIMGSSSKVYQ